jgi:hypothetical protein
MFIEALLNTHTHTHTHTLALEYYSAIKENEIILFAGKLMELEIIMLNEISQMRKTNIASFLRHVKFIL